MNEKTVLNGYHQGVICVMIIFEMCEVLINEGVVILFVIINSTLKIMHMWLLELCIYIISAIDALNKHSLTLHILLIGQSKLPLVEACVPTH